jgi:hypothetical protein
VLCFARPAAVERCPGLRRRRPRARDRSLIVSSLKRIASTEGRERRTERLDSGGRQRAEDENENDDDDWGAAMMPGRR